MQKLFENWRRHINEGIADDFLDTLKKSQEEREARPARAAQAKEWEKNPPTTEEEWEEFKKWKRETEAGKHRAASPEEYEKARTARKIQKPKETLAYNCQKIKPFLRGYEWRRIGTFSCNSLEEATQGLKPGTGKLSQVFSQSRLVRTVGEGAFGVALLFDNGHIVKIFKGGIHGASDDPIDDLKAELKTYSKLLNSQFGGSAKSYDLSVYEYGTIPVYIPDAERNLASRRFQGSPVDYIGYAEIGKVIPFESWVSDNFNEFAIQADQIKSFFSDDLYSGLSQAANRSRARRNVDQELKSHHIKSFDQIPGGAEDYANYVTKWIENKNLENNSDWVQKYGWAGEFSDFRDINKDVDPADIPAMPEDLQSGRGAKLLKDFLVALYDIAKSNGDEYLYGKETRDVHTGNFGISYQTGEVIIFDR